MNEDDDGMLELLELVKDRNWRMNSGLYLIESRPDDDPTAPGKVTPLVLRSEQVRFLRERHTRNFVPKARKLGLSTVIVISNLDECLWTPDLFAAIIDKSEAQAFGKLGMARFAWERGIDHPNPGMAQLWKWIHEANPVVKDADGEMAWSNGSRFRASTSETGNSPDRLHVSELGPIAAQRPAKAQEIKRGSINSVLPEGIIDIETTMEGGRFGVCYDFFNLAKRQVGKPLTGVDWKLQFFPWWRHPSYDLPGCRPYNQETLDYFAKLEKTHGLSLPDSRQAWWEKRRIEQGDDMWQQYPSTIDECDMAVVAGQIYAEMATARSKGRVTEFEPEPGQPIFTFWDLGASANTAGWLIQKCGRDWNALDFCVGEGAGASAVAEVMRSWERQHGPIAHHYVPHDAKITDKGSGKTYLSQLVAAGIPQRMITVVPRTPDVWVGIDEVRNRILKIWWHTRCDVETILPDGSKLPSGVGRIENYRRTVNASTGILRSMPFKDNVCDHAADALRTFAEADSLGLVHGSTADSPARLGSPVTKLKSVMGLRLR